MDVTTASLERLVPYFPSLPVDNVRSGFFERGEVEALLQHVGDEGVRDFIAWGFRTGMRKGEIARLTWEMPDRSGVPWVLRIPAAITKNRTGRTLGLEGEVRAIVECRLKACRFDTPLIFHRECRGKPARPSPTSGTSGGMPFRPRGYPQEDSSTICDGQQCGR